MVKESFTKMKEEIGLKMQSFYEPQWTRNRRPETAIWKIPKMDARRESYSKSAPERGNPFETQSLITPSSPASSLDNYSTSGVINLQSSNGSLRESYRLNNISLFSHHIDRKLPLINSSSDVSKTSMSVDGSSIHIPNSGYQSSQTYLTSVELKTPWYISLLHEKERYLLKLGEEINRLSRYEVECKKKDEIICNLKNVILQLESDLQQAVDIEADSQQEDTAIQQNNEPNQLTISEKPHFNTCPINNNFQDESKYSTLCHRDSETNPEGDNLNSLSSSNVSESHNESEPIPPETKNVVKTHRAEGQSNDSEDDHFIQSQTDGGMVVPNIIVKQINELQKELDNLKKDHEISKGTIFSLKRQVSLQESQLRRTESKKDILEKHLKERVVQIQAMSTKFSSLREERKHEDMMAAIEKDNFNLRELISELKSELMKRNDVIGDLKTQNQKLQKEISEYQTQVKKREDERNVIQSKAEDLESSEQHVKVSLECLQSRFERFRSKIIQATFSAPGVKFPHVEIPDNEALEAMQRIITERSDYHQQLKQKGVKVPPLHSLETITKQLPSTPRKNK
ncbi:coiled-coil domain-containing protein 27-like [Pelobates fuscus]|uniref:coiled-coil domain-containing protein 27-like n=1 Tax=Pelobates fuscus TaxID=191477 RepID=UPI002FE4B5B2